MSIAFDLFAKMYEEEGYQTKEIPTLILQNNIYGIDIDPRCYQLASFALTMKAREYYRRYLRNTVTPNVIALQSIDHQTIESTGSWAKDSLVWQMENLDTIGSLLKITPEECAVIHVEEGIFGQTQRLMKTEAEYLSRSYHCVITNPPYLGKGIGDRLKQYITQVYPNSKADTMATFMDRCADFCTEMGKWAMINMHSWMYLSSYTELRKYLISSHQIESLLHLGPRAFEEISGEVVQCSTFVMAKMPPITRGIYYRLVEGSDSTEKETMFLEHHNIYFVDDQKKFLNVPSHVIAYNMSDALISVYGDSMPFSEYSEMKSGVMTGNDNKFISQWYEPSQKDIGFSITSHTQMVNSEYKWFPVTRGGAFRKWYGNFESVAFLHNDGEAIRNTVKNYRLRDPKYYFRQGLTWTMIGSTALSVRYVPVGILFGNGGPLCFVKENEKFFCALLNSKFARLATSILNPTLNIIIEDIDNIPVKYAGIDSISNLCEETISISKQDWDAHETSWDFQTNELVRIAKEKRLSSLHQILADYKREWEEKFMRLHENEEEINRKFIEIYGLQDELTPDVPLDEVTILQKGEKTIEDGELKWNDDAIIKQFLSYLVGCFMGRYAMERPGLVIANQGQHPEDLDFTPETIEIDDDGIIPIIQEPDFFADNMTCRIENAVEALFEKENKAANIRFIETALGCKLRDYFFKNFYTDHTAMYSVKGSKRPIYWLFTSKMGDKKKKGYFKALVYMHRLEPDTLSKLHADYVVPYINALELHLTEAENELAREDLPNRKAVMTQADTLRSKIREVKEFSDELAKMASHRQTIDLDDGVAVNYPKFYPLLEPVKFPKQNDED